MKFRTLRADEIECRVSTVSEKGCSLLLYKDARCDMILLDEAVGSENWQRKHEVVNGNLFCSVGIFIPQMDEWVWKQDVGTESYTEKEKGQASDSFKRACVNWGIGRELYTAPFIWIPADKANLTSKNGKTTTYDRFCVNSISYDGNRNIKSLSIVNSSKKIVAFRFGTEEPEKEAPHEQEQQTQDALIEEAQLKSKVLGYINRHKMSAESIQKICKCYGIESIQQITSKQCKHYIAWLEQKGGNIDE